MREIDCSWSPSVVVPGYGEWLAVARFVRDDREDVESLDVALGWAAGIMVVDSADVPLELHGAIAKGAGKSAPDREGRGPSEKVEADGITYPV